MADDDADEDEEGDEARLLVNPRMPDLASASNSTQAVNQAVITSDSAVAGPAVEEADVDFDPADHPESNQGWPSSSSVHSGGGPAGSAAADDAVGSVDGEGQGAGGDGEGSVAGLATSSISKFAFCGKFRGGRGANQ